MPIPANPVSLGDPTKKTHYDTLYNNAVLANTGGTPGGAQTIPGVKTFSGGLISMMDGNIASVSADYTILDDDNYKQVLVTTSSSTTTVTLPTLAANLNRTILIMKADSGTGEVYIEGEGAETINGFSTLYLNRKYQKVLLLGGVGEWIKLDGEPSYMQGHIAMGGGFYMIPILSRTDGYDLTDSSISDTWEQTAFSGLYPSQALMLRLRIQIASAEAEESMILCCSPVDTATNAQSYQIRLAADMNATPAIILSGETDVLLGSGQFYYRRYSSTHPIGTANFQVRGYWMGF